jgi:hypothetical protein
MDVLDKPRKPAIKDNINGFLVAGALLLAGCIAVKIFALLANAVNWSAGPDDMLLSFLWMIVKLLFYLVGLLGLGLSFFWVPCLMVLFYGEYDEYSNLPTRIALIICGIICAFYEIGIGAPYIPDDFIYLTGGIPWDVIGCGCIILIGLIIGALRLLKDTVKYPKLLAKYQHEVEVERIREEKAAALAKAEWERMRPEREKKAKEEAARKESLEVAQKEQEEANRIRRAEEHREREQAERQAAMLAAQRMASLSADEQARIRARAADLDYDIRIVKSNFDMLDDMLYQLDKQRETMHSSEHEYISRREQEVGSERDVVGRRWSLLEQERQKIKDLYGV